MSPGEGKGNERGGGGGETRRLGAETRHVGEPRGEEERQADRRGERTSNANLRRVLPWPISGIDDRHGGNPRRLFC